MERRLQIVGVLNVTPDSFHDGGKFLEKDKAVKRAGELLSEGADILEIGGESTGPGSKDIDASEEMERILPMIDAIRKAFPDARISVDTYKSEVAEAVLAKGVTMINDVTAGRGDAALFEVLKRSGAKLVLMYAKDPTPRTTIRSVSYDDVVATIKKFLRERKEAAVRSGIAEDRIILDPGLGHFVSGEPQCSFEIIARLLEFTSLGSPLLLSPSRKSFLAGERKLPTSERLPGTIAASAVAVLHGVLYIRTHDVEPVRRACEIAAAIRASGNGDQLATSMTR